MTGRRKATTRILSVICAGALLFGMIKIDNGGIVGSGSVSASAAVDTSTVHRVDQSIDTKTEELFDPAVVYQLTDTVKADTDISVIVTMSSEATVYETFEESGSDLEFSDYVTTSAGQKAARSVSRASNTLIKKLNRSGVKYTLGYTYDTVLSGFEIIIKAGDYTKVAKAIPEATLVVSEEYEKADAEVVTNDVDVYDTGIFDSSKSEYQGDGVVVAVLDTGLDYTHSAFSNMPETVGFEKSDVKAAVDSGELNASKTTSGLTVDDVYYNAKVPFQYDYADEDPDVFPINSEHGTHVSGIIAGQNKVITGVAPNAQIAAMKVFSDSQDSAKNSWVLAALEDCVVLGVDVINMSLGAPCGFARDVDNENMAAVYEIIEDAGISLVCAASNDYNATMGSEKNGNNGLTSNPDSGTVGSPSTYEPSLSVASVSGVMDNYMLYNGQVIYFNEATDSTATERNFFDDILRRMGTDSGDTGTYNIEYVVIPGLGRSSDYPSDDPDYYKDKIVVVRRGTTTFEEKIRVAMDKGALGIIIYNNLSGTISMSIGQNADCAACSISQDDGEMLVAAGGGTITISKTQEAGPFMSEFSSWGPTSDLRIKPEITAHGGEIYSCVPGEDYIRYSGTSMASPNQAGVTALIRQYVKDNESKFGLDKITETTEHNHAITAIVNELMMSTADIIYNKNALPYAVRKQGAGLVNLYDSQATDSYIVTYERDTGEEMSKSKIELKDDKEKTGVYEAKFTVKNVSDVQTKYRVDALIQTEGVSATYTGHGDTTMAQEGYALEGTKFSVESVSGDGSHEGDEITVDAHGSLTVNIKIVLSEEDKEYMDESFEYGMYVEGFITLEQLEGTGSADSYVDLNIPLLTFYGDWTEAPIFDEEYYDTNADELNAGLDDDDKLMADAYATRVIGGLYSDYIAYMGSYYFNQDPSTTQIAASKEHIAMSNQGDPDSTYNINNLAYVYAGLLRNVAEMDIEIVEDATGKVIYTDTVYNQRKSYGSSSIYTSSIDLDHFSAADYNLKNNTQYTVTLTGYIDYGEKEDQKNVRNTFSFPLYIDYEAPVITGAEFRKETDRYTNETSLYVDLEIYDNHYAMAVQLGNVVEYPESDEYLFEIKQFGKYATPVYSSFNSTSIVTFELTDYIDEIKNSQAIIYYEDGTYDVEKNSNTFIAICYDYAMNQSVYEIRIPDEVIAMYFSTDGTNITLEESNGSQEYHVTLALNETLDLTQVLQVYPSDAWVQAFDYTIATAGGEQYVRVVNQTVLALDYVDDVVLTVTANTSGGKTTSLELHITVSGNKGYTLPVVNSFSITDYYVNKAFYIMDADEREIGYTGYSYDFSSDKSLSMYPSESITIYYDLQTYFPDDVEVQFSVGNSNVATVDKDGVLVAKAEGSTTVTATVYYNGRSQRSDRVYITVKDPFTTSGEYLMYYRGNGGEVVIPDDRGITTIYSYAFSNYEYVDKDLNAGDVIDDEDPYNTKTVYIGETTITSVVIPEGVIEIDGYAFAGLTALTDVYMPSTLTRIGYGAFEGCTSLKNIHFDNGNGLKFINEGAFDGCTSLQSFDFSSTVAIGKYAFRNCDLYEINLPETCQTISAYAFESNKDLWNINIKANSIKLDTGVFAYCTSLGEVEINASVIPSYAFYGCTSLTYVYFGRDVSVINEYAFTGTEINEFGISPFNQSLEVGGDGALIYSVDKTVLYAAAPVLTNTDVALESATTTIYSGAFSGSNVKGVSGSSVERVLAYAFANCRSLESVSFGTLTEVGDWAFYGTELTTLPNMTTGTSAFSIGAYSFADTRKLTGECGVLNIPDGTIVGDYAFYGSGITELVIGDNVTIGTFAFADCDSLEKVAIGNNVMIGDYAFYSALLPTYEELYEYYGSDMGVAYYISYINETDGGKSPYVLSDYYAYAGENVCQNVDVSELIYTLSDGTALKMLLYKYSYENAYLGSLTSVRIGAGSTVGAYAFANNVTLEYLIFGDCGDGASDAPVVIGDYAFYNCMSLGNVDFGGVSSIGAYAFSVNRETVDLMFSEVESYREETFGAAYRFEFDDVDELVITGYQYTIYKGAIVGELDLSHVTYIGEGAFAYNVGITSLTLSGDLSAVGAYAFYQTGLNGELVLSDVTEIGAYAFANTEISSVSLYDAEDGGSVTIGDGAFYGDATLSSVENMNNVSSVGAYAFAGTAISEIDISKAWYVGDFAFADIVSGDVIYVVFFNDEGVSELTELGENPFRNTNVVFVEKFDNEAIEKYEGEAASGSDVGETEENAEKATIPYNESFVINGGIFVSDGVLYQEVNTGWVLVSYPVGKTDSSYTLEDGTVRISASAFEGNEYLYIVTMSSELVTIGDKAFYTCDNLGIVVFTSYTAPALEEEYDEDYQLYTNIPMPGYYGGYEGLGIVDYFMWTTGPNNFFYGANFVDYIGKVENKLVMIAPVNGQYYDSFTYSQYFGTRIDGAAAASSATLALIADIAAITPNITLESEAAIIAAMNAYSILSPEQQALVSNYDDLYGYYQTLLFIQAQQSSGGDVVEETETAKRGFSDFMKDNWVAFFVILLVLLVVVIGLIVLLFVKPWVAEEAGETSAADGAQVTADGQPAGETPQTGEAHEENMTSSEADGG
ncbi:MAG: leucine-rich repeat protein, partial [Bacteroidales bacterium]|nr:leucine-rich repeat protein [Bacteroidales bacterium]